MSAEVVAASSYFLCGEEGKCGSCATQILQQKEAENYTYNDLFGEQIR